MTINQTLKLSLKKRRMSNQKSPQKRKHLRPQMSPSRSLPKSKLIQSLQEPRTSSGTEILWMWWISLQWEISFLFAFPNSDTGNRSLWEDSGRTCARSLSWQKYWRREWDGSIRSATSQRSRTLQRRRTQRERKGEESRWAFLSFSQGVNWIRMLSAIKNQRPLSTTAVSTRFNSVLEDEKRFNRGYERNGYQHGPKG